MSRKPKDTAGWPPDDPFSVVTVTKHGAPFRMYFNETVRISKVETLVGIRYFVSIEDGNRLIEKEITEEVYRVFIAHFRKFSARYLKERGFS
jgi:hypothetical protein